MSTWFSTAGIARASALHPWKVLGAWVVILALSVVAASGLADALTSDFSFVNKPESVRGLELIDSRMGESDAVTETVIVHSDSATVDDPAFQQVVEQTTADLAAMEGVVHSAVNYYQAKAASAPTADALVSADRHTTIIPITLVGTFNEAKEHAGQYIEQVESHGGNGMQVLTVGDLSSNETFNKISESDLQKAEVIGLPAALIILIIVFGALVAASVPVVLALASILVAVGLTALVGRVFELSFFVVNMITMIGLAVGIDYTLFIISRYREERRHGRDKLDAITVTGGTASKAVLFSGCAVFLALLGLFLIPTTIFRSLGTGAILVVVVALAAMLTLVPAMLSLLGDRIEWPRRARAAAASGPRWTDDELKSGFWGRITGAVMRHPVISLVLATAFLLTLAVPYLDLQRGNAGVESLPESNVKTAYSILNRQFSAGLLSPVEIVVNASRSQAVDDRIQTLIATLQSDPRFQPQATVEWSAANDLAVVKIPLSSDPNAPEAYTTIRELRGKIIPSVFGGSGVEVLVTGGTAFNNDFFQLVDRFTPIVFAFVLGLSFLLLMLAFRSIVVPLKAILMNLLSVGAAYGLLVAVFQKGWGTSLLGFQHTPTIEAWIPIFLFCVLFGLSMDYHVFLLSRIREHYDQTRRNRESVAVGLQSTAKIITGAALIMVVVFAGFASGQLVMLQQVGFGLAVAIFLDATVVRSIIVPSAMALLGDINWYMPKWLHWLPDLRVEGDSHLAQEPALQPSTSAGVSASAGGED